jgi:hypothetical protein
MLVGKKKPRKILFPIDFLQGKAKREYIKKCTGKVVVYTMSDKEQLQFVKSLDEISKMDFKEAKAYLERLKHTYLCRELTTHWSITSSHLYKEIYPKYNIETQRKKKDKEEVRHKDVESSQVPAYKPLTENDVLTIVANTVNQLRVQSTQQQPDNGLSLRFIGTYTGQHISDTILNLATVINKELTFKVDIRIAQIEQE